MSRKGQGLSLNTIIIAAIVLTVFIVLVMVFTGRMGWFTKMLGLNTEKTCADYGGTWESVDECGVHGVIGAPNDAPDTLGYVCCKLPEAAP